MADRVGQHIEEYRLVRRLGAGAFGEVYLGEHVRDRSQVAVKMLHLMQENLKEFIKEASTALRLRHPHIVQLLSFGINDDDTPYLIMAYASNGTLRDRHPRGTRLALNTVISYLLPLASALQYAHDSRVVHRDVKPENILIGSTGEVLLSDFGIAVITPIDRSLSTQNLGGTAPYMAPEQIRGKPQPASDQYALGIMVYEWLCGARPFQGNQWEILEQQRSSSPPSLCEKYPDIPLQAEEIIFKALAKDTQDRFASVQDFATALAEVSQENQFSFPSSPSPLSPLPHVVVPLSPKSSEDSLSLQRSIAFPSPASPPENMATPSFLKENYGESVSSFVDSPRADIPSKQFPVPLPTTQGGKRFSSILVSPPAQPRPTSPSPPGGHRRVALRKLFLFLGLLFLIVGGGIGVYYATTNPRLENISHADTQTNMAGTAQVHATATSQSNASATAQANVPGRTWHGKIQNAGTGAVLTGVVLTGVAWSGSQFVAVGVSGTILTSPDGRTWSAQSSGVTTELTAVVWSGSQFMVVGDNGTILTSPDGRTWSAQSSGTTATLTAVVWSGSQFMVVGDSGVDYARGVVLTSPDGHTWSVQTPGISQFLQSIAWSGALFVTVGEEGAIYTSPDGRIWTPQFPGAVLPNLNAVDWSSSRSQFVVVGDGGTTLTSP